MGINRFYGGKSRSFLNPSCPVYLSFQIPSLFPSYSLISSNLSYSVIRMISTFSSNSSNFVTLPKASHANSSVECTISSVPSSGHKCASGISLLRSLIILRFFSSSSLDSLSSMPVKRSALQNGNLKSSSTSAQPENNRAFEACREETKDFVCLDHLVNVIRRDENDMESTLNSIAASLSINSYLEILRVLNTKRHPAVRFFNWIRDVRPSHCLNSSVCSLIVDNCGRLEDFETMHSLLTEFQTKNICLNRKAFGFLLILGSSKELAMDSIRGVVEILNKVGGSCHGTGIFSLIEMLCSMASLDMARFVIDITEKKASYYNILVREYCSKDLFTEVRKLFEEMRRAGHAPDAQTYNHLVGRLCKVGKLKEALIVLREMLERGCNPDAITYEVLVCYFCRVGQLGYAVKYINQMISLGIEPRLSTHATLIKSYVYYSRYEDAHNYVAYSAAKRSRSTNGLYSLLANLHRKRGNPITAQKILVEMLDKGFMPLGSVYASVMRSLHNSGRRRLAKDLKSRFCGFQMH